MRENVNTEHIEGRIFQHNLAEKTSKKGVDYIGGTIDIAVDEECLNVIQVRFGYVTPCWGKTDKPNKAFPVLKKIIEEGKTVLENGKDEATKVKVGGSLALNEFFNAEDNYVSAKVNDGSFIEIVKDLSEESKRNTFNVDMLIIRVNHVDADEEKRIEKDFTSVAGFIFNFRKEFMPVEFTVTNPDGMKFFEGLEVSASDPVYTNIWGRINSITTLVAGKVDEADVAFGTVEPQTYERKIKTWEITGAKGKFFEFGEDNVMTKEEYNNGIANIEVHKAEIKKNADEYKASKAAGDGASGFTATSTSASSNLDAKKLLGF